MNRVTRDDIKVLIDKGEEIQIDVLSKTISNVITHTTIDIYGGRTTDRIVKEAWTMDDDQLLLLITEYGKYGNFHADTLIIRKKKPTPYQQVANRRLSGGDIVRLKNKTIVEIADIHNGHIITPTHTWYSFDEVDEIIKKWNE